MVDLIASQSSIIYLKLVGIFLPLHRGTMKYTELEKRLRKAGCFDTGEQANGHPLWYSPITAIVFRMSNHRSEEVAPGTLNKILKVAGLK